MELIDLDNYPEDHYESEERPSARNFLTYKVQIPAPLLVFGALIGLAALFAHTNPPITELPPASIVVTCDPRPTHMMGRPSLHEIFS